MDQPTLDLQNLHDPDEWISIYPFSLVTRDIDGNYTQPLPLCSQLSVSLEHVAHFLSVLKGRDLARKDDNYHSPLAISDIEEYLDPGIFICGFGYAPTTEKELVAGAIGGFAPLATELKLRGLDPWDINSLVLALIAVWDHSFITGAKWIEVPEAREQQSSLVQEFVNRTRNLLTTVETSLKAVESLGEFRSLEVQCLMRSWISDWEAEINA